MSMLGRKGVSGSGLGFEVALEEMDVEKSRSKSSSEGSSLDWIEEDRNGMLRGGLTLVLQMELRVASLGRAIEPSMSCED